MQQTRDPGRLIARPLARLIRAFAPEQIILFGSYAKGSARPGSDVDLLVIADLDDDHVGHLRRARQLVADSFPPVDVVLCTPEDVADALAARSPFIQSVLNSGITLWRRDQADPAGQPQGPGATGLAEP